ncbi:soluble lamin-associated protein of 75 kDa isoform X1 [Cygnus atratus]|uniref:soluble lamin-associated protein of 75 kDa isoform X1 n=1 Tax=Cygnus atratus TaxID=8868 RepID=UPI0015D5DC49|nr:soluble lamin-associated protein of 75 kDa isoform X1 [Cygnus atratus]XP_035409547.1 soluble lamin-associated protein of 75 kDa isoform X1 [Cygnus atratus]XP_035409548.1 soluble lamin-associated protein of 75 kDa isoform X1 [Cygnus atratus]XP_035409549.1 soluble lamin-associated protein of 75 kDa isoform X1 [Cygnus atratus]
MMAFPVDMLSGYSHEDLESSAEDYLSDLRCGDPNHPEYLSLPDHSKIPISLSTVGFVPLYGGEQTHKVLALFAPEDSLTAVALYLADRWWSIDDILRTSVPSREGLQQVKSVGERVVLYVLNRIIYRKKEIERNEVPFLCHSSNDYAKILWRKGEAIGFYSVKPKGSVCSSYISKCYQLPVLDTMFVRKKHRGKDLGLMMLEDFVDSFTEDTLGLRYPLSTFMCIACKQYFEKYPGDHDLLCEAEGVGFWFQRTSIATVLQREELKIEEASEKEKMSFQTEDHFWQSAAESEASEQKTELEPQLTIDSQKGRESLDVLASTSEDPDVALISIRTRSSHLKRPRIGKNSQDSGPETSQGDEENVHHVPDRRLEVRANLFERFEVLVEEPEENADESDEEMITENEDQSVSETELHISPSEKVSEKEEAPSESLNGEVAEETGKTSLTAEEETANEALGGESKLQSESQGEEPVTLLVPLILESPAKPAEDTVSDKAVNANDSEALTEESTSVEKKGSEEDQQESEKKKSSTENAVASAPKEEPSDNGLPNNVITEAAEESVSENVSPKTASSVEDQNEEAGHNSQEAPDALGQSSLIVVELEGVSFQQPSGQEGQKNQLEEHLEESADQYTQTAAERAADSSSEEAEIEVPIVDRRNLRRKAKGYKGPPKKKGKPA